MAKLQGFLTSLPLVQGLWEEKAPPKDNKLSPPELSFYRGVEGEPPVQEKAKEASRPAAQSPPPASQKGEYNVQVASFKEEAQALGLVRQLKEAGLRAYLLRSEVEGVGLRFRVRVGPFMTQDEAQGAASRIRLQQKLAAYVTRGE
jgi:cell division septation protein DedD